MPTPETPASVGIEHKTVEPLPAQRPAWQVPASQSALVLQLCSATQALAAVSQINPAPQFPSLQAR